MSKERGKKSVSEAKMCMLRRMLRISGTEENIEEVACIKGCGGPRHSPDLYKEVGIKCES